MTQSTEVQTPAAEKPKYLYPVSYRYYLIGQYALLGISIIVFGDFIFALILEVVHTIRTEDGFAFNARLLSDLGICAVFLAGVFFTHRHKERIREMVGWPAPTEWSSLNVSALSVFAPSGSGGVAERSRLIRLAG